MILTLALFLLPIGLHVYHQGFYVNVLLLNIPFPLLCYYVQVSSKTKHVVHYSVKSGDIIIWEFATKKRDIGFGEV